MIRAQAARDEARVGQRTDTHSQIDAFVNQIDKAIGEQQLHRKLGESLREFLQQERQVRLTKRDRSSHAQCAAWLELGLLDLSLSVSQLHEDRRPAPHRGTQAPAFDFFDGLVTMGFLSHESRSPRPHAGFATPQFWGYPISRRPALSADCVTTAANKIATLDETGAARNCTDSPVMPA
jgi:hypothetical protein